MRATVPLRNRFIRLLREREYSYKKGDETTRTQLYKQRGSRKSISVPKGQELDEDFVRRFLRREGYSEDQIKDFLDEEETD